MHLKESELSIAAFGELGENPESFFEDDDGHKERNADWRLEQRFRTPSVRRWWRRYILTLIAMLKCAWAWMMMIQSSEAYVEYLDEDVEVLKASLSDLWTHVTYVIELW